MKRVCLVWFGLSCLGVGCGEPSVADTRMTGSGTALTTSGTSSAFGEPTLQATHCISTTGDGVVVEWIDGGWRVNTPHYELWLSVSDQSRALELGRLAEASWLAFSDYFGASPEPGELPLKAFLYATPEQFTAALEADGLGTVEGSAGMYHPNTKKVYATLQPTRYYENSLMIHEWLHQFHYLARTGNRDVATWYAEGLAEYLSRHDWEDDCLRLGVIPLVSQEDFYAKARDDVDELGVGLEGWLDGDGSFTRARAMAVVGWLERYETESFDAIRLDIDGGDTVPTDAFATHLPDVPWVESQVDSWIHSVEEPMTPRFIEWTHLSMNQVTSRVDGSYFTATEVKSGATIQASVTAPSGGQVGVLVAWDGPDDHMAVFRDAAGQFSLWHLQGGVLDWTNVSAVGTGPSGAEAFEISVMHDEAGAVARFGGAEVPVVVTQRPATGLATYGASIVFDELVLGL